MASEPRGRRRGSLGASYGAKLVEAIEKYLIWKY